MSIKQWLFVPVSGSNRISLYFRKGIERIHMPRIVGLNLAGLAFMAAIVVPGIYDQKTLSDIRINTNSTTIEVIPTESTYQWPLNQFGLSQRFSLVHPGIDLTSQEGTPIEPVTDGIVLWTNSIKWGYGNHILVEHKNGAKSLYAHLSKIDVEAGDKVSRTTVLGNVGTTGWSTGDHLHLEMYQENAPINPQDVLPKLKESY
jgi:murein DD-endopeptidase MepM/ murein hydrolase activator NlpD